MDTPSQWRPSAVSSPARLESHPPPEQAAPPVDTVAFFIRNIEFPEGRLFHAPKPENITFGHPAVIKRPALPEKRQATLQMLDPCTLFVQYPCQQKCRSLGICAITANRKCPLHQDPVQTNPISSRPEDFLATRQQKEVYDHILQRSFACFWHDLPFLPDQTIVAEPSSVRPMGLHRETTPKDLRDVQMLEGIEEHEVKVEASQNQTRGGSGPAAYTGSLQMGVAMPQLEIMQSVEGHARRKCTW
ncbi:hypothetical protein H2200_001747 [Cladophialophora chaetospira]|uniref:Uncharacterized protein n=1 Tax=Cladophialophora chaetospira TaxID=386627 RepID=A0AA39CPC7_9EURO|nr:hypothetical protein H2200_001747 [Cladophialophora chaetospira]